MSYYEPQTAKKVYLYRNGTINADAKLLVVNDRQVRDFSTFLNRVTSGIRAPVAVRNIYTPMHGHKVRSLEELESGRYYVAGGSEQFKKVKYGSGPKLLPRRQQRLEAVPPSSLPAPHVIVAEARYKRPVEKPFVIHVFRNGDELFHGVRVLLPKRVMAFWDHVLETVTEKADLYTPAKKLCTLDGEVVTQLQDGGKYVAVEGSKPFRKVAYCATNITTLRRKRNMTLTLPVVTRRLPKPWGGGWGRPSLPPPLSLSITAPHARPQPPPVDPTATLLVPPRRKVRPMAGRRNKEARERALLENRDDSVFGGSPVMQRHPRMPSPPPPASATNFLLMHTNGREPGEGRGRGHVNFHGNHDNDVMNLNPLPSLGGGAHDSNEEGVVTRIVAGEGNFKMGSKTEVTISIQDSDLTPYPPQPPSVTDDSLVEDIAEREGEVSTDDLGAKFSTEGTATLERGHNQLPEEGVRNEIPNQGVRNQVSRKGGSKNGSQRGTPSGGTKINVPPERVQNNTPPEGAQNSAPTEVGQTEISTNENSQTQLPTTNSNIPTSKKESRKRKKSGRKQINQKQDHHQTEDLDKKSGGEGEASISENIPDAIEVEDKVKSKVEGGNEFPIFTETSQAEPEEVPEEEGVANRSEVKEETEEPEMKLQGEEVELVSHTPQTTVDLTLTRKHQEPVMNADDRGEESLPHQQTETLMTNSENGDTTGLQTEADGREGGEGERENTAENDGLTPPTQDSQATPPTPPTNDDDEQVLIVE